MDNMRALLIGGAAADAERLAVRLLPDATVICFAADRAVGDTVKRTIASRAVRPHVSVMLGDPTLLVHKVAGPFDLIVDAHGAGATQRERLLRLLREDGNLDG